MIYKPQQLATQIKLLRAQRGISQAQLSALTGIKQASISKFESAPDKVRLDTVFKIMQGLEACLSIGANAPAIKNQDDW